MPKIQKSSFMKLKAYVIEFPNEFAITPEEELYCSICAIIVNHDRRSTIAKHRESNKHRKGLNVTTSNMQQSFLTNKPDLENEFRCYVLKAFMSADIPIYKANNSALRSLFAYLGRPLPSESNLRSRVSSIVDIEIYKIRNIIAGQQVFVVIDESDISSKRIFNTLIGTMNNPEKTYLIDCTICNINANHQYVIHLLDDILREFRIERDDFTLLLSDAARYMIAAGSVLKELYPRLLHVTCISHLFHNCAMKIRSHYSTVDNLIARLKASIVKNKERRNMFREIGIPPEPIITRWGSWLKAAMYYADNLPEVRNIINNFTGDGVLVKKAKEALLDSTLNAQLLEIKRDYECLINLITISEKTNYSMLTAYNDIITANFGTDSCGIRLYLDKRLRKNADLVAIASMSRLDISPSTYNLLQKCQASSASVERSFSMLKKMLASDRPFKDENIKKYFILYYNGAQETDPQ